MTLEFFDAASPSPRTVLFQDDAVGLRAILCIDDLRLGPAAGGIRTWHYASTQAAFEDARRLSRAMSIKCALAGLRAGGAKTVVLADSLREREAAFRVLGQRIEELGGLYRCAGDLGTTDADLEAVAKHTDFVHTNSEELAASVARGTLRCLEALVEARGREMAGLRVAVQGCGSIGAAVAQALSERGAKVLLADLDPQRAEACAASAGATVVLADRLLASDVDVLVPCAKGGVLTKTLALSTGAFGVCGAANNQLASPDVGEILRARGVLHIPDVLASAGAVIDGIGKTVMNLDAAGREALIDGLKATSLSLLERSEREGRSTEVLAEELAKERMERA